MVSMMMASFWILPVQAFGIEDNVLAMQVTWIWTLLLEQIDWTKYRSKFTLKMWPRFEVTLIQYKFYSNIAY